MAYVSFIKESILQSRVKCTYQIMCEKRALWGNKKARGNKLIVLIKNNKDLCAIGKMRELNESTPVCELSQIT